MSTGSIDMGQVSQFLLATEVKGALLLLAAALGSVALHRSAPAARHWVWLLGMAGLLALPAISLALPSWSAPVPKWASFDSPLASVNVASAGDGSWTVAARLERTSHPASGASATAAPALRSIAGSAESTATNGAVTATRPPRGARDRLVGALSAPAVVLSIWGLGTGGLLLSLLVSLIAVARLGHRSPPFEKGRLTELADQMRREMRVRTPVRLLRGDPGAMPMSWGLFRPVILLPEGAERWHSGRLVSVLLHELAHVRRRDCSTQIMAEVALALHWPNPLAWLAVRRLRVEREHACDDAVVAAGARPSDYAQELLSLAQGYHPARGSAMAAVAMARPVHLAERLRAVLTDRRTRPLTRGQAFLAAGFVGVLVVALAAFVPEADSASVPVPGAAPASSPPSFDRSPDQPRRLPASERIPTTLAALVSFVDPAQEVTCASERDGWRRVSSNSNNGSRELVMQRPGCDVELRMEGDVQFTADFREVAGLGRGALFRVEENDGRTERRLEITPGSGGQPTYAYRVNGTEQTFDSGARSWYRGVLLQLFRRVGFMADDRVAALLRSGGVAAVLQEIDLLDSDHVFAIYASELLEQATLSEAQVIDLLARTQPRVDSDHYMSEILEGVAERHLGSDRVLDAFIAASRTLESDHYRSEVLEHALERTDLAPARVAAVLASAVEIESDHYLAELLESISSRYALEPALRETYLRAVESIESDHYRSEVLSSLLERSDLDAGELSVVLQATSTIRSDHYRAGILEEVAERALPSDQLRAAYLRAATGIESDHYRSEALGELLERQTLSTAQLQDVIRAATSIASDHYKAELLSEVVRRHRLEGAARAAFIEAMDSIESRTYRGQVAEALLRSDRGA